MGDIYSMMCMSELTFKCISCNNDFWSIDMFRLAAVSSKSVAMLGQPFTRFSGSSTITSVKIPD